MRLRPLLLASALAVVGCSGSKSNEDSTKGPGDSGTGALFFDKETNAVQPSLALDAAGGIHIAYAAYTELDPGEPIKPLRYAHCAAACEKAESWKTVDVARLGLGDSTWPTLQLDASGRPRVGWYADGAYRYSSCDGGCEQAANWGTTEVLQTGASPWSRDYFALDPAGRPAFVYGDYVTGAGTFLVACDSGCDDASSWSETLVADGAWTGPKLAFAGPGRPRLLFSADTGQGPLVGYAECDSGCADAANWNSVGIYWRGTGAQYSLRVNAQGQPRLALYVGYLGQGKAFEQKLLFGRCNADCTGGTAWTLEDVGLTEQWGEGGVDLALDAQGNPHLAFSAESETYGLGYVHCTANCDGEVPGQWTAAFLEKSEAVDASNPVPAKSGCSLSSWFVGKTPSLAIAGSAVRVAYGAEHLQGGSCSVHTDMALVRVALANP